MKTSSKGTEHTKEKMVNSESPSTIPNKDKTITCAIMYSNKTMPNIRQIVLQGEDLEANARPLGGGVSGAIMVCMRVPERMA